MNAWHGPPSPHRGGMVYDPTDRKVLTIPLGDRTVTGPTRCEHCGSMAVALRPAVAPNECDCLCHVVRAWDNARLTKKAEK